MIPPTRIKSKEAGRINSLTAVFRFILIGSAHAGLESIFSLPVEYGVYIPAEIEFHVYDFFFLSADSSSWKPLFSAASSTSSVFSILIFRRRSLGLSALAIVSS